MLKRVLIAMLFLFGLVGQVLAQQISKEELIFLTATSGYRVYRLKNSVHGR